MKSSKTLLSILVSLLSLNTFAAQSVSTKIYNPYGSIRALGMGNAFSAVADDYSLILYNPAGFARKKHNEIQFSLVGAGVSTKTLTLMDDINKASGMVGTDAQKAQAVSDVLEKYYGESLGGKIQAAEMFYVRKGWGFAILPLDLTIDMSINKQLGPAIDLNIRGDTTFAVGYGREFGKNIDGGITLKYVHRVSVEEIVPAFELATDPNVLSEKRFKEGTKFDFDIGTMWRPNWFNSSIATLEPAMVNTYKPETPAPTPEEPKQDEVKPDDKKTEEERKPQAEGDATEVKVADETKPADIANPEVPVVDQTGVVGPNANDAKVVEDKKAEETKKEEEAKAPEPAKTETAVASQQEKFPLTFSLVMHNVLDAEFTLSKQVNKAAVEVPTKMNRVVDVGSQYMIRDGEDFKIRYMLDFQNLLHPEITLYKSFHTGVEFDYSPNTWFKTQVRAGLNQMYFTGGASFLFGVLNIDLVTYGEEVGTADTRLENRVSAAKIGFNF